MPTQEQIDNVIKLRQLLKQNAPSFYEHYKKYKLREPEVKSRHERAAT